MVAQLVHDKRRKPLPASTFRAAKTLCDMANWQLTNLPLQKLLYLAHMYQLGAHGTRLIDGEFEAWDLGPVEPRLYRKVKAYGSRPIVNIFSEDRYRPGEAEYASISRAYDRFGHLSAGELVAITHCEDGAWSNNYRPGVRGTHIPDEDILNEYRRTF